MRANWGRTLLLGIWGIAILTGLALLTDWDTAPGAQGSPPRVWPASAPRRLDGERPTLLMFAHPRCPCTRASLEVLAQIVALHTGVVNVQVLFWAPAAADADWTNSDLWKQAHAIPGITVSSDADGRETARFGIKTSGHVLLFGADGKLLFSGGITAARGQVGDNPGKTAVEALLAGKETAGFGNAIFGCELFDASATCTNSTGTTGEACRSK